MRITKYFTFDERSGKYIEVETEPLTGIIYIDVRPDNCDAQLIPVNAEPVDDNCFHGIGGS